MQITILTNGDLPSVVALNILVPQLAHHDLSIFFSSSVGRARTNMPKGLVVLKYAEQAFFTEVVFPDIDRGDQPYQTDLRTFAGLAATIGKPVEDGADSSPTRALTNESVSPPAVRVARSLVR